VVSLEESKAEAQRLAQEASQASETLKQRDAELQDKDQEIDDLKSRYVVIVLHIFLPCLQ
jgi:chromosome segregation ATPase